MGGGRGGNGETAVKGYTLPVIRGISAGDLMHSIVAVANNNELLRLLCSHHKKKKNGNYAR